MMARRKGDDMNIFGQLPEDLIITIMTELLKGGREGKGGNPLNKRFNSIYRSTYSRKLKLAEEADVNIFANEYLTMFPKISSVDIDLSIGCSSHEKLLPNLRNIYMSYFGIVKVRTRDSEVSTPESLEFFFDFFLETKCPCISYLDIHIIFSKNPSHNISILDIDGPTAPSASLAEKIGNFFRGNKLGAYCPSRILNRSLIDGLSENVFLDFTFDGKIEGGTRKVYIKDLDCGKIEIQESVEDVYIDLYSSLSPSLHGHLFNMNFSHLHEIFPKAKFHVNGSDKLFEEFELLLSGYSDRKDRKKLIGLSKNLSELISFPFLAEHYPSVRDKALSIFLGISRKL